MKNAGTMPVLPVSYSSRPKGIFTSKVERLANMPYHLFPNRLRRFFPKIESLKPFFAWVFNDKIKQCLDKTTQHITSPGHETPLASGVSTN
eukprot:scaffold892_cov141-Amphora_coffeaeformis.AAC.1